MKPQIVQMTEEERNKMASKFPSLRPYWTLWKILLPVKNEFGGEELRWHYGFLSREQAENAIKKKPSKASRSMYDY